MDGTLFERVVAIVPCFNEEVAIGAVVTAIKATGIDRVIVVDGSSTDGTVERARAVGAHVIVEARRGYGRAMQTGLAALPPDAEIILFVDGDGSDRLDQVPNLLAPLFSQTADFVHGTRLKGEREAGALSLPQVVAGHLAGLMIRVAYGVRYTDMSPFRAIRRASLGPLGMKDTSFGWNLEMQMRAAAAGLRIIELPVGQRRRVGGVSKVSGNIAVVARVVWVLATTFIRLAATLRREPHVTLR